jgi:hypothetical protein
MDYEPVTEEDSEDINSEAFLERLLAGEDGDDDEDDEGTEMQGEWQEFPRP